MRWWTKLLILPLLGAGLGTAVIGAPGQIEEITVHGLFRMTRVAFLHAFEVAEGDPYDPVVVRRRFRALWELGLFEDLSIEAETGPGGGTVLVVKVKERPVLTSVVYDENKVLTQTQIDDALEERGIRLGLGKPIDPKQLADAEAAIRDLLGQRGFLDSRVTHRIDEVTEASRSVTFSIKPGRKTRIRGIDFVGNELFKDRALKKRLELTEPWRWYWPWSKKTLYHPLKWDQDVGNVRDLYLNFGYLDIDIEAPVVQVRAEQSEKQKKKEAKRARKAKEPKEPELLLAAIAQYEKRLERTDLSKKKRRKLSRRKTMMEGRVREKRKKARIKAEAAGRQWVYLVVPVHEGRQYTLGEVTISGNSVLTDEQVRGLITLREGAVLENFRLQGGVDLITRAYENRGRLYASVRRQIDRREGEAVADVHVTIDEDEPYRVARIEFSGNTSTQDRVLRRELVLNEGDLFHRGNLEHSQRKLNQLGYWTVQDEPLIEPIEGENRVRVRFVGEEQGRQEIQVGGGYSGLDGAFFSGVYSTRNFLGRGQVLSTALQIGGRANRYSISFTEPWFLNRPFTLGFRLFRQDVDFGGSFESTSSGAGLVLGRRVKRFGAATLAYNYETVSSTALGFGFGVTPGERASNTISSLTPSFVFDTINNPFRPTSGRSFRVSLQIAGGPLGGDTAYLKPIASFTGYKRPWRRGRGFFGLHGRVGLVRQWQGGGPQNSANVNGVPRFQRFWLGGDTLGPRIFETRTISPQRYVRTDSLGRIVEVLGDPRFVPLDDLLSVGGLPSLVEVGGDRFYLVQAEYVFPINQQVEFAAFLDAGDALFEDQSFEFDTLRVSAGLELRFHLPVFPVPLRLIYGTPVRELEGDRTSSFQFSVGRSF